MTKPDLIQFISGAIVFAYAFAALYFLRFWRDTHDRLFGFFAASFTILALQRMLLAIVERGTVAAHVGYLLRAAAFLLIIIAIIDKNRADRGAR